MSNTITPPTPSVPVGPSTIVAIVTAVGAAAAAVVAAIEDKTAESTSAAAVALGAVVTLVASRTSQANALAHNAAFGNPQPKELQATFESTAPYDPDLDALNADGGSTVPGDVAVDGDSQ